MRRPVVAAAQFALIAALLLTWAMAIGRYGGPDEPAHVLRAYAAAHGDLIGDPADPLPEGYRLVTVPASLGSGDPACYRHDAAVPSTCASASGDHSPVRVATSAGLTPPLYHLVIGLLARASGTDGSTTTYRTVAALLHALVLTMALRRAHARAAAVAIGAAVTPAVWFLLGVVNPSSFEVALALLAWVGACRLAAARTPTRADAWWVAAPLALAIAARPIAVVTAAAVVLVVELRAEPKGLRRVLLVPPLLAAASVVAWGAAVHASLDDPRTAVHRSVLASFTDSVGSLGETAYDAVASLGWNEVLAPRLASLLWVGAWTVAIGVAVRDVRRGAARPDVRPAAAWLAVLALAPVLFETTFAGAVGPIWQGRYSLPALLGISAVVAWPLSRRIATAMVSVTALAEAITYWAVVRRYAVGTRGSWWLDGAARTSSWLSPRAWLVLHLLVVAAAATAAIRHLREPTAGRTQVM
jgi:hypothetical protein